jgi:hypothetical protein
MRLRLLTLFAILAATSFSQDKASESARANQKICADFIEQSLSSASTVELFAIDYRPPESEEAVARDLRPKLLDWWVAGQTTLSDRKAILALASSLVGGIKQSEVGIAAACFNPRHAVRWKVDGKEITIVVCFQCGNGGVFGLEPLKGFLTTKEPQDTWDRIFSAARLPKVK